MMAQFIYREQNYNDVHQYTYKSETSLFHNNYQQNISYFIYWNILNRLTQFQAKISGQNYDIRQRRGRETPHI